jgi:hypothetical protein
MKFLVFSNNQTFSENAHSIRNNNREFLDKELRKIQEELLLCNFIQKCL